MLAIISRRTYGVVSLAAFQTLARRFRYWERVLHAPLGDVEQAIHEVKYSEKKAEWLQSALMRIGEARDELRLYFPEELEGR